MRRCREHSSERHDDKADEDDAEQSRAQIRGVGDQADNKGRDEESDAQEPADHGETDAVWQAGQLVGGVHHRGNEGCDTKTRNREPGHRCGE